ncbi:hypothetical protein PVAND_011923 [Polypedilum vanderplanki]|uniref:RING-type domain-containing protein n=1 Tax=Polypedilum vanderplanki TaxID=319348 RepID=A0A9J6CK23_POLVA|nr:hypothetical protein PVAND_011923 [Polypedilum vanderplanki]
MCDDSMQNYNQNPVNFPFQKEKTEIFDLTFDGNKKANSSFTDNSQHFASTTFTNSTTNYQSESNSNLNLQLLSPPPAKIRILTEPLNNYNNSMPSSSSQGFNTPHVRMCRKCSFHGQKNPYKNHTSCPYKFCICSECQILNARKQKRKDFYNRFNLSLQVPKLDSTIEKAFDSTKNDSLKIRHEDKVEWIQYTNDLDKGFLVEGGKTNTGVISYIGRGYHNGHLLPTAIFPSTNPNNIALFKSTLNGNVYHLVNCEALIIADFEWKKNEMGKIPSNAVFCGIVNDDFQYVGRALYNESIIIGRVSKESGCLYILYGNEEILIQSFEVLVDKNNDITLTDEVPSQPTFDVPTKPSRNINENQCTICFESPVVGIFKECMHACLCADCIDIVNRKKEYNGKVMCPICRKLNYKAEKFFMV